MDSELASLVEIAEVEVPASDPVVRANGRKWLPKVGLTLFVSCVLVSMAFLAHRADVPHAKTTVNDVFKAVMLNEKKKEEKYTASKGERVDKDKTKANCLKCVKKIKEKKLCGGLEKFRAGKLDQQQFENVIKKSFWKGAECFALECMEKKFDMQDFCADPDCYSVSKKRKCDKGKDGKKQEEVEKVQTELQKNETKYAKALECNKIQNCKPCLTHAQCDGMESSGNPPKIYCCPRLKKCIDMSSPDTWSCYGGIVCGKERKDLAPGERPSGCSQFSDGYPFSCSEVCKTWDPLDWVKC